MLINYYLEEEDVKTRVKYKYNVNKFTRRIKIKTQYNNKQFSIFVLYKYN